MSRLPHALPFWLSFGLLPLTWFATTRGGLWILLLPAYAWVLTSLLDLALGESGENPDPDAPESLFWHKLLTWLWVPAQAAIVFGTIFAATRAPHLSALELVGLFYGVGIASGTIGIVYAHELMHQRNAVERWLGDVLMAMALYSHFRSEHLIVHHSWVGTRADAVTARYGEGFWAFFARVVPGSLRSAWRAEARRLARAGRSRWSAANPFWRYALLQGAMLALAVALGGALGLALFVWQAFHAVLQLEQANYIEHYGLTRRHLGEGRYEPVRAHHSWNAGHRATNWLLINLQRHSDHHARPDRRFPLLQTYTADDAPQLPAGYPTMAILSLVPRVWRRRMNPRVRAWRRQFYPDITDWGPYDRGELPLPRGMA